ncbi:uncharacterized protein DEA37_0003034 [Paragonimus westermani]|uniref:Uncharacterized protein n=1 Tax=Paragonimus westermani TaxID=34504 RepID=A0A5J4NFG1_9TREM|nr:uncharacterized protein DEA37_0003034 [Paragonimus westermani]
MSLDEAIVAEKCGYFFIFQIPYHNMVPTDPSFSQMRSVVCANLCALDTRSMKAVLNPDSSDRSATSDSESRPPISPRWLSDPFLSRLTQLVQECWHWEWSSRLSALRVPLTDGAYRFLPSNHLSSPLDSCRSKRFCLSVSGDAEAASRGQARMGFALSSRAEQCLFDWIPVNSRLCAVRLNTSVKVCRRKSEVSPDVDSVGREIPSPGDVPSLQ